MSSSDYQRIRFMGGYVEIKSPRTPVFQEGLWVASSIGRVVACDEECYEAGVKILQKYGYTAQEGDSSRFVKTVMFSFTDLDLET